MKMKVMWNFVSIMLIVLINQLKSTTLATPQNERLGYGCFRKADCHMTSLYDFYFSKEKCCKLGYFHNVDPMSKMQFIQELMFNGGRITRNCVKSDCSKLSETSLCDGFTCDEDRVCQVMLFNNRKYPQCVCAVVCSTAESKSGPICDSDGIAYRNKCALRNARCHLNINRNEGTAPCKPNQRMLNCEDTQCQAGSACMLSESGVPQCHQVPQVQEETLLEEAICLVDGYQAKNVDDMQRYALEKGYLVREAYFGACEARPPACKCVKTKTCLRHHSTQQPNCFNCDTVQNQCKKLAAFFVKQPVCGSDGRTYTSRCNMVRFMCKTKTYISLVKNGSCIKD